MRPPFTLSMDPGLRQCGLAIFEGPTLVRAWLAKSSAKTVRGPEAWQKMAMAVFESWILKAPRGGRNVANFIVEVPQIYWGARKGGNVADLVELIGVVGAVVGLLPVQNRVHYLPRSWKGSVPKDVHNKRVLKKLTQVELDSIEPTAKSLMNNVVDGVGLGLFFLNRMRTSKGTKFAAAAKAIEPVVSAPSI